MKRFLFKLLLFISLFFISSVLLIGLDFFVIKNQYEESYNASLLDKVDRLKQINEPKIILVGHSNLAFGINSEMIEKSFHMPVVNLGLHGDLGNAFHEEIAKINISEGDIIIVCHSDFSDDDTINNAGLAWYTIEWHRNLWCILRKKDYFSMIESYPNYLFKAAVNWIIPKKNKTYDTSYARSAFNQYGDVVMKPENGKKETDEIFFEGSISVPKISELCINRLNNYNNYIKNKGATLLVAGYPIAYGEYTPEKIEYINFQRDLESKLDCTVISNYIDYFIPYHYFYDTILHLTDEGAIIRTEKLIMDIQKWMSEK